MPIRSTQTPLVSVIIPSFNYAETITQTIQSVLSQSYRRWELIIFDDGSKDRSPEIIQSYARRYPDKVFYYTHPKNRNKGLAATLKLAIKKARGKWVAFLEADDAWDSECLKSRLLDLEGKPPAVAIFNGVKLFGDPTLVRKKLYHLKKTHTPTVYSKKTIFTDATSDLFRTNCFLTFSACMAEKETLSAVSWPSEAGPWLDWWVFIQLCSKGSIVYSPKKLTQWRIHLKSYNQQPQMLLERRKRRLLFLQHQKSIILKMNPAIKVNDENVCRRENWISDLNKMILKNKLMSGFWPFSILPSYSLFLDSGFLLKSGLTSTRRLIKRLTLIT